MAEINFNDLPCEIMTKIMNINKEREKREKERNIGTICRVCGENADDDHGPAGANICEDCYDNYDEETGEYNPNAV